MNAATEIQEAAQLLRPFCADSGDARSYMHTPHAVGGRAVATNGHWFAVLPAGSDVSGLGSADGKYDPSNLLLIADALEGDFTPACEIGVGFRECSTCTGTGKVTKRDCEECDGDGEFRHGSHWYDCRACDGSGTIAITGQGSACEDCDGRGKSGVRFPSTLGDRELGISAASYYVEALRHIGGEISSQPFKTEGYGYLWGFRFPGGRGLLMPMTGAPMAFEDSDLASEVAP